MSTSQKQKLKIIWATTSYHENEWEYDWIRHILDGAGRNYDIETIYNNQNGWNRIVDDAPVIIVCSYRFNYLDYITQYEVRKIPFGVIHLSDEWLNDDMKYSEFTMCKFVFRNYYRFQYVRPNVHFLPLGYKRGYWDGCDMSTQLANILEQKRKYIWSFAGTPRTDERKNTVKLFEPIHPHRIIWEMGNSFGEQRTGLNTSEYRQLFNDSYFAVCPIGNVNVDCFRVSEALECGCIPIVISWRNNGLVEPHKSYWECLLGENPPFIVGDTWEECFAKVTTIVTSPDALDKVHKMRMDSYAYWCNAKKRVMQTLADEAGKLTQ